MSSKLKEIRMSKNFTQKQLAEISNVSLSYIQKLELGLRKNPGIEYAKSIAKALDTNIEKLFY